MSTTTTKRMTTKKKTTKRASPAPAARQMILDSLAEIARATAGNKDAQARMTTRTLEVPDPSPYTPAKIRALRRSMNAPQSMFAKLVGVSVELVESWEQGLRAPAPLGAAVVG